MPSDSQRKAEVAYLHKCLERKNKELDALHYVWCSGGCEGGVHRFTDTPLTAEMVAFAIRNTDRLINWYVSKAGRDYYGHGGFNNDKHTWEELEAAWNKAKARIRVSIDKEEKSLKTEA